MSEKLSALMTVYNEADFVSYAIRSILPHVDKLVLVEGAYEETMQLGAESRSTDGTLQIIENLIKTNHLSNKIKLIKTNKKSDKDHRNVGLDEIKKENSDGWMLIVDGDEVWSENNIATVKSIVRSMDRVSNTAAIFRSLTFVNDFKSYVNQDFPRLFKMTSECSFVNDNYMIWPELKAEWRYPFVVKIPYVQYCHYAFCKSDKKRFLMKRDWWNTRFSYDPNFEYDWYLNDDGSIYSPNHQIHKYVRKHPKIMESHPMWKKSYERA